jgi:hypothetical protein
VVESFLVVAGGLDDIRGWRLISYVSAHAVSLAGPVLSILYRCPRKCLEVKFMLMIMLGVFAQGFESGECADGCGRNVEVV